MDLISCSECKKSISPEAVACPYCGASQPVVMVTALPIESMEVTIYSDNAIVITNMRLIVGGATYALRNITSVKMLFTPPRLVKPILLLVVGLIILLAAFMPFNENAPAPIGVYTIAGAMIVGAILRICSAKTMYHVGLSSALGEVYVLTSKDKAFIQHVVQSINDASAKHR